MLFSYAPKTNENIGNVDGDDKIWHSEKILTKCMYGYWFHAQLAQKILNVI